MTALIFISSIITLCIASVRLEIIRYSEVPRWGALLLVAILLTLSISGMIYTQCHIDALIRG